MNLNSPDESASHKDGSFTSRLSDKWPDIFGASCTFSVKWELVYLAHQGACKTPPISWFCLYLISGSDGQEKQCLYAKHFMLSQNDTWFSSSNLCLLSRPWCHRSNDRVLFQRLSALTGFCSICLFRIERRFKARGVEPGFISFNLNPIMRLCKSLSLSQLFCFRDSQEEVQELEGWETSPQHHTHSTILQW